jgi:hypothetical protein
MHQVVMQLAKSQNPGDALGGDAVNEITKSQDMHQVVMQSVRFQ